MRASSIGSIAATAALLFATQIAADLDPIVIKVSIFPGEGKRQGGYA